MTPARLAPGRRRPIFLPGCSAPLFSESDLRTVGGLHVAVPRGAPWYAGHTLGEVALQISSAPGPGAGSHPGGPAS